MFKVGQKVVCVQDRPIDPLLPAPPLRKGKVYSVLDIDDDTVDIGLNDPFNAGPWWVYASRFVPLDDTRASKTLTKEVVVEVPSEELELN